MEIQIQFTLGHNFNVPYVVIPEISKNNSQYTVNYFYLFLLYFNLIIFTYFRYYDV